VLEAAVEELGYQLDRLGAPASGAVEDNDDDKIPDLSHVTPAYKRALWIVVLLNVGYGVVEIFGSFLAGSQALQADSLDFIGDGLISFLGLIAVGWGLAARAKAALLQGIFLGLLGVGVIISTLYRVFVEYEPQTMLMAGFAIVAAIVNILAAVVLIPHRKGDANVRAVWLFSRNDAIGNLAVVAAAGLVWLFASPWPDLVVAFAVAALFLQSAWSIIKDARGDLRTAQAQP
jgi:cation diffusion facilitator family transporter